MSSDKQPMQADGKQTSGTAGAVAGSTGAGESGGGPRSSPQRDTSKDSSLSDDDEQHEA